MFQRLSDFLTTGIVDLIPKGKGEILFATYNNVSDYPTGIVSGTREGLTIKVQNGNLEYSPATDLIFSPNLEIAMIGKTAMEVEARTALLSVSEKVESHDEQGDFLAVIYAGLSAFDESIEMARKVKQNIPTAKVVITTCDCDLMRKEEKLIPLFLSREIDAVVVDNWCGGRDMMRKILEAFLNYK